MHIKADKPIDRNTRRREAKRGRRNIIKKRVHH